MKLLTDCPTLDSIQPRHSVAKGAFLLASTNDAPVSHRCYFPQPPMSVFIYCFQIVRERVGKQYYQKRINQNFVALEYVKSGSMYFRQNGQAYLIEPGDLFILRSTAEAEFCTGPDKFCEKSSIILTGNLTDLFLRHSSLADKDVLTLSQPSKFDDYLDRLTALQPLENRCLEISSCCFELLQYLINADNIPAPLPPKLTEVLKLMKSCLSARVSMAELAKAAGISLQTLNKLCRTALQTSPHKKLTQIRMSHAAELLETTSLSVKEIAAEVSYDNALNFSTEFKKHFGISPRLYREHQHQSLGLVEPPRPPKPS